MVIELEFDTTAEAEAFGKKLYELWGRAGEDVGLTAPEARVFDSVEAVEY